MIVPPAVVSVAGEMPVRTAAGLAVSIDKSYVTKRSGIVAGTGLQPTNAQYESRDIALLNNRTFFKVRMNTLLLDRNRDPLLKDARLGQEFVAQEPHGNVGWQPTSTPERVSQTLSRGIAIVQHAIACRPGAMLRIRPSCAGFTVANLGEGRGLSVPNNRRSVAAHPTVS